MFSDSDPAMLRYCLTVSVCAASVMKCSKMMQVNTEPQAVPREDISTENVPVKTKKAGIPAIHGLSGKAVQHSPQKDISSAVPFTARNSFNSSAAKGNVTTPSLP